MLRASRLAILSFLLLGLLPLAYLGVSATSLPKPADHPKLLVLVVFDQLRGDFLERWSKVYGKDGFNRLTSEGAWYTNCHYPYSMTVTGAGHATLGTGCTPSQHGIIENDWYDRVTAATAYCATIGDRFKMIPEGAKSKSGKDGGGAPGRLLVPALGDYVKEATQGKGKVIGLSLKDRGGVLPTGAKANFCFWYDNNEGAFVSSNYYADSLPAYMTRFNQLKLADRWFGKDWTRFRTDINYAEYSGPDDVVGEGTGVKQGRTFPHPMTGGEEKPAAKFYDAVYTSPMGSDLTWECAKTIIENEKLGQRDATDYLAISYSSNDSVGHAYGPDSQEVLDITLRSDKIVADMIDYLDKTVGRDNYVIALSADHGVCPLPEVAMAQGHSAGRVDAVKEVTELELYLKAKYLTTGKWIAAVSGAGLYLNYNTMKAVGKSLPEVEQVVAEWFKQKPYVQEVYTRSQMLSTEPLSPIGQQIKACFHPDRSGDILPVFKPYWFLTKYTTGTTHGSPHPYDTHVPLVFFGGKVKPGKHGEKVSPQLAAVVLAQTMGQKLKDSSVEVPANLLK